LKIRVSVVRFRPWPPEILQVPQALSDDGGYESGRRFAFHVQFLAQFWQSRRDSIARQRCPLRRVAVQVAALRERLAAATASLGLWV
jgi:hypothetical protein